MSGGESGEGPKRPGTAAPAEGAGADGRFSADFEAAIRRQARIIAANQADGDDQAFVDSISMFDDYEEPAAGGEHGNTIGR